MTQRRHSRSWPLLVLAALAVACFVVAVRHYPDTVYIPLQRCR